MAKYLRPKRGTASNVISQNVVLKSGELFLEFPTGTNIGKSAGRIVVGDGSTPYSMINYASTASTFKPFITDPSLYTPIFNNSTYASSDWTYNAATASIDKIGNGTGSVALPTIIGAIKETLCKHEDTNANHESRISALEAGGGGGIKDSFLLRNELEVVDPSDYHNALPRIESTASWSDFCDQHGLKNYVDPNDSYNATDLKVGQYFILYSDDDTKWMGPMYIAGFSVMKSDYQGVKIGLDLVFAAGWREIQWNTTKTTEGGFANSNLAKYTTKQDWTMNDNLYMILYSNYFAGFTRRCSANGERYLSSTVSSSIPSMAGTGLSGGVTGIMEATSSGWNDLDVLTEAEIRGFDTMSGSYMDNSDTCLVQLPIFKRYPAASFLCGRTGTTPYLLKNVVSSTQVAGIYKSINTVGYYGKFTPIDADTAGYPLLKIRAGWA